MKYVEFLQYLLTYGPKIGPVLEEIQAMVDGFLVRVENIRVILGRDKGPMRSAAPTEEESILEGQVLEAALGGRSAGPLQSLLDFIRANPEIIQLIMLFLK